MIRHFQTILADPERNDGHDADGRPGDCFRTALGCLLDLPPNEVPHFLELFPDEGLEWWESAREFVRIKTDRDLIYLPIPVPEDWEAWWGEYTEKFPGDFVLLSGASPRGPFAHVVIGHPNLTTFHDPHPSQSMLASVEGVFLIAPLQESEVNG